jgi:hypothetical protein
MRAVEATRLWGRGAVCHAFRARGLGLVGFIEVVGWRQWVTLFKRSQRFVCDT